MSLLLVCNLEVQALDLSEACYLTSDVIISYGTLHPPPVDKVAI